MTRLEDLKRDALVRGILPKETVTILDIRWHGDSVVELTYRDSAGRPATNLFYRDQECDLEIVSSGRSWNFQADGFILRLVSEAYRIKLAHLFDPHLAVHTSLVDPLPHQITAVYGEMLRRQPLRYLLADDPGAGKTIMAGLFIKELLIRGDVSRCLIVCPGMLVEQWQDELDSRFQLPFEILTNDKLESARTGNWFFENNLAICRLDKLSRNEELQAKLKATDWDLIICDEAHKMSASIYGGEVKATKRYRLGQMLSSITRHFLLLTATPHNGKEEDFQLFMALLDGDRFEGKFLNGIHVMEVSDVMRRMVKEHLVKMDGTPLFPERRAYTASYQLSDAEIKLYQEVTNYVRDEFNRADALNNEGRKGTIGFALTTLQRRLASSPEAIYQSLKRRKERLEKRLREEKTHKRALEIELAWESDLPAYDEDDINELDDSPDEEIEAVEEDIADRATAARTITELEAEIVTLQRLEKLALEVRRSGTDRKWDELSRLLQHNHEMFDPYGNRRKLVLFTEHRDTLNYLTERIRGLLGNNDAVVTIHGGMLREDRRKAQESFKQDRDILILVATDAAGEGINLQRAHLMVNYDIPWNPNRIEQRFGRIHRIGQSEVCHLWNLVAEDTREGEVLLALCKKLEKEAQAMNGQVFDVLGKAFRETPLRKLLIEAILYGESPEVRNRHKQTIETALDHRHINELVEEGALASEALDANRVQQIREDMERAAARRLQPHYIASFFKEAFKRLGGQMKERESKRYEITHVPGVIRSRDRLIGRNEPILNRYERIAFDKELINFEGKPLASFICPGHPLLDSTIDLILERYREILKQGAVLVDPDDSSEIIRALFYLEHAIQDARLDRSGNRRIISKQIQFVEIDSKQNIRHAGYAPYLNYRPLMENERDLIQQLLEREWLNGDLEAQAVSYAITEIVPRHQADVKRRREELILKTMAAVKDRLTKEINYWDHRAADLEIQEQAGKQPKMNSQRARQRADDLQARLQKRMEELEQERQISPLPPVVIGGAIVVPQSIIERMESKAEPPSTTQPDTKRKMELMAMHAVLETERRMGNEPIDVSAQHLGYDIESRTGDRGRLRFIEVKGRTADATTVTISTNEILTALNKPEDYILAVCTIDGESTNLRYIRQPFQREPDFGVTSVNYKLAELLARGEEPS